MKIERLTKKQAIEMLLRINRWNYIYDNKVSGDARFRIKVDIILQDIEDVKKVEV